MWSLVSGLLLSITFLIEPILFLLHFAKIGYFSIRNDEDKIKKVFRYLEKNTISTRYTFQYGKIYPCGTFIGWNCCGYYTIGDPSDGLSSSASIHIITTRTFFDRLTANDEIVLNSMNTNPVKKDSITLYGREGPYTSVYYSRRTLDVTTLTPQGDQSKIVSDIVSIFSKKNRATVFIHGVCGAGKSTIGLLLAKQLNGSFCHTFNPTMPGDLLHNLVRSSDIHDNDEKPIVVVIEEVNTLIRQIHANEVVLHKNVQTSVYNKSTYNTFMDDMILYKNVILILTSNESLEDISALDPCYLRRGRVDGWYSMMNELSELS